MKLINKYGYIEYIIDNNIANIIFLEIKKKYRQKGYGSKLLKQSEKIFLNNGVKEVIVSANQSKLAISFWIKNNFVPIDKKEKDIIECINSSDAHIDYIFDIDQNSIILMKKIIK